MRDLDISWSNKEQRQNDKSKQEQIERQILKNLNMEIEEDQRVFDPHCHDDNPDVPEITEAGFKLGNNRYYVARNFFDERTMEYCKHMFKFMEHRKQYYREKNIIQENYDDKGAFLDNWVSKGFPFAPFSESILLMYQEKIEKLFGVRLIPTYSYGRTYERHSRLLSHSDRPSCEFSATLPVSFNTDDKSSWKIWVRADKNYSGVSSTDAWKLTMGKPFRDRFEGCIPVELNVGDVLFYQGSNVIHWRERLVGKTARQIFIHYLNKDGPMNRDFGKHLANDSRPTIYHGTGSLNHRLRDEANKFLQNKNNYKYYANVSLTDPETGKACGKGYEKFTEYKRPENQFPASKTGG